MALKKRLGEMLIEADLLDQSGLQDALRHKGEFKLGEYLIRKGVISEEQIIDLIGSQLNIQRYTPKAYPLNLNMAQILPADISSRYKTAPLLLKGNLLTVAMVDPTDIEALDAVEIYTNREVEPLICSNQEYEQIASALYGGRQEMDSVMDSVAKAPDEEMVVTQAQEDVTLSTLQDMAEEAPVIRLVNSILSQAVKEKASDVHISPEKKFVQVRFRIDGKLQEVPAPPKTMFLPIVSRLKILANMDIATSRIPQDGRFTINMERREINVRASTLPTIYGENVVLRLLDMSAGGRTLDDLGMDETGLAKIESVIFKPYGMILATGPTGSGKSTTLYAMLHRLNQPDINIITLEDPVEYRVEKVRQVQLNTKAGMTFASGLRSVLRQDPDVVMVGEIRDHETANISVQAALTGHRLLSTVHTNDAAGAITRFIDMGIEPFLISSVLLVSIAQRLVRRNCPHCLEEYIPEPAAISFWGLDKIPNPVFKKGKGCFHCNQTGYKGRVAIYEILVNDDLVQEMTLRRSSAQEITAAAHNAGRLRTLKEDAAIKVLKGLTTLEEATTAVMT
ncbi:MAG: type II/IV secretion system protein [Deltaproteobacteria bacterium]|nr:type II/IV secretion system protein [Deltaproteobacteria bacterium]